MIQEYYFLQERLSFRLLGLELRSGCDTYSFFSLFLLNAGRDHFNSTTIKNLS